MRHNDPNIIRARKLIEEWVHEINQVGMMSAEREYVKGLILRHLESKIVAEYLIDLLAREFAKDERRDTETQTAAEQS